MENSNENDTENDGVGFLNLIKKFIFYHEIHYNVTMFIGKIF